MPTITDWHLIAAVSRCLYLIQTGFDVPLSRGYGSQAYVSFNYRMTETSIYAVIAPDRGFIHTTKWISHYQNVYTAILCLTSVSNLINITKLSVALASIQDRLNSCGLHKVVYQYKYGMIYIDNLLLTAVGYYLVNYCSC